MVTAWEIEVTTHRYTQIHTDTHRYADTHRLIIDEVCAYQYVQHNTTHIGINMWECAVCVCVQG